MVRAHRSVWGARVLAGSLLLLSCSQRTSPTTTTTQATVDAAVAATAAPAPPTSSPAKILIEGVPWQHELRDGEVNVGVISVPLGAAQPRPIMIVLHGAGDRPEWECGSWRGITNAYPFLVCPRGVGSDTFLAWSHVADSKARIERALKVARATYPQWIKETPSVVIAGFSMGGNQVAEIVPTEPARYKRVVLTETAFKPEPAYALGKPWMKGGGERILFVCTTPGCEHPYRNAAKSVKGHARVNLAGTFQHGMWDEVVRSVRRDWPWLVEGAEGWEAYAPPAETSPLPGKTIVFE